MILKINKRVSFLLCILMIVNLSISFTFDKKTMQNSENFKLKISKDEKIKVLLNENQEILVYDIEEKLLATFETICAQDFQIAVDYNKNYDDQKSHYLISTKCGQVEQRFYKFAFLHSKDRTEQNSYQIPSSNIHQIRLLSVGGRYSRNSTYVDSICGDYNLTHLQQCDDGNLQNGDGCSDQCKYQCGDSNVTHLQICDDGNRDNGDGCSDQCRLQCGDGSVTGSEQCDDGNRQNGDGCSDKCHLQCGDAIVTVSEQCDDGNRENGDGCSSSCTVEFNFNWNFNGEMLNTQCGDGTLQNPEQCDDGNLNNGDGCSSGCKIQYNWNFHGNHGNYGNLVGRTSMNCGNGKIQEGEQCDDGNFKEGDGCSSSCKEQGKGSSVVPLAVGIPVGVGSLIVIGAGVYVFMKRKKQSLPVEPNPVQTESAEAGKSSGASEERMPDIE